MDDGREALSGIDRALADALDIAVSPGFEARVRQRIARSPKRRPFWPGWRIAVPAAVAAALTVTVGITMLPSRAPSAPQPLMGRSLESGQTLPAVDDSVRGGRPRLTVPRRQRPAPDATLTARANSEPEVLVPREEIEIYRRLMAAARNAPGAIIVEAPKDIVASAAMPEITIDPIRIDLIIPPVSGEGGRQ